MGKFYLCEGCRRKTGFPFIGVRCVKRGMKQCDICGNSFETPMCLLTEQEFRSVCEDMDTMEFGWED